MSELSSADSGLDLQRLRGQDNYSAWARDFKLLAGLKGVWDFYTGEEPILQKPLRSTYNIKPHKVAELSQTGEEEMIDPPTSDTTSYIAQYKLEMEEYERNQKKLRIARSLLAYWVDPSIRGRIQAKVSPKEAWEWLQEQYKMHGSRALDLALSRFEKCTLESSKGIQDYINKLEGIRLDIEESGGSMDDPQLISKLIRGLSSQYAPFVDQYYFLQGTIGFTKNSIHDITSRLLTYESKHVEYTANGQTPFAAYGNAPKRPERGYKGSKPSGIEKSSKLSKVKCDHCSKWHAGICWEKFPAMKEEMQRLQKQGRPSKGDGADHKDKEKSDQKFDKDQQPRKRIVGMAAMPSTSVFLDKLTEARANSLRLSPTPSLPEITATLATTGIKDIYQPAHTEKRRRGRRAIQVPDRYDVGDAKWSEARGSKKCYTGRTPPTLSPEPVHRSIVPKVSRE